MRQIINIVTGFFFGLAPFAIATIIGLAVYDSFPNITGIIIFGLLAISAIWMGLKIFNRVQIVGPIEFMTAVRASPDLDNLEPTKDSETKRRRPDELAELFANGENLFKAGYLRIYGDWFGKLYDTIHKIKSVQFDRQIKVLTLTFMEGEKLEIFNPEHIFEASAFFKIINADRIKISWFYHGKVENAENQYYLDYKKDNKKILTETNVDWYKPKFDISLGDPALMIYG